MTDEEINEAVARKLGYKLEPTIGWCRSEGSLPHPYPPNFCHDIAAAWDLIPQFNKWSMHAQDEDDVCFSWIYVDGELETVRDKTAPMAICRAFLKLP